MKPLTQKIEYWSPHTDIESVHNRNGKNKNDSAFHTVTTKVTEVN